MATTQHLRDWIDREFKARAEGNHALCSAVSSILGQVIPEKLVVAHGHRVKTLDSFYSKSNKIDENGKLKYQKPFDEITDIVGFRVIVIAKRHIVEVCEILRKCLEIVEEENKAEKLLAQGRLGYESHHLIARLGRTRDGLMEYKGITDKLFEIQVRTALQHAWAENEHRVQYKSTTKEPELNQRFLRLAAAVSSADEEFDRIYEINEKLNARAEEISDAISSMGPANEESKVSPKTADKQNELNRKVSEAANMFGVPARELMEAQRYPEAIRTYDKLIELQPKLHSHYMKRAEAKALSGDMDGAIVDFGVAEDLKPDDPTLHKIFMIIQGKINE